ncbi:DUF262 domain-containing protein [Sphingorhabdus contaminans]|uniref:DUF262 domain-containing protein n=1 Tax=Sphingorhabdus contaminans TaxID=1343899 RepID=A0A553WA96_9SPHN|nr:DUF262 domain-containing protein [Sphingorhabdus contaminans]TSB01617.1 DUF262 domain-containing protein [Sphingorhabdus contaminans]
MRKDTIDSEDLSLSKFFQSFYRVPDYQREYVWGEKENKGQRGDEVEQFLADIYSEFDQLSENYAPEYFIGTVVVCEGKDGVYDLIDGQQRSTTVFLTLCAIRDALSDLGAEVPDTLTSLISASKTDHVGQTVKRLRLDLQYEDASNVLVEYGLNHGAKARREETRSIRNLANAYEAIRDFLRDKFGTDAAAHTRFYGYFTNLVKLIRIETPSVSRALKIFETINDRGAGLDAMDLLKNLLFMHAKEEQFDKLKSEWKSLTQEIYEAREKPLRFLRYFILANFDVGVSKLREEEIYDWLIDNKHQTHHEQNPINFATKLKEAARAYKNFNSNESPAGRFEHGLANTRALGGPAIKQHFILLLAGRHLSQENFERLCFGIEEVMCVWLIAGVPAKEYDGALIRAASELNKVSSDQEFSVFMENFVDAEKSRHRVKFVEKMNTLKAGDVRQFRLKYLLAKFTQFYDLEAYGENAGKDKLSDYLVPKIEIEHVFPENPSAGAIAEFGEFDPDDNPTQRLGNLILLEKSPNVVASNEAYSVKSKIYSTSAMLLTRCQATKLLVGENDRITKAVSKIDIAPLWNLEAVKRRQDWYAEAALDVWNVRNAKAPVANTDAMPAEPGGDVGITSLI